MPNERTASFSDKEKEIFLDVIEQHNKYLLSTYTNSDKAKSTWNEITRDYNSVARRSRSSNQLRALWTETKEKFYKTIVGHGIKIIFDFSHQELRALRLIPSNYFSNLCKTMEFERCLKTASALAKQTSRASTEYVDSKDTILFQDDWSSDQLSDNSQSNVRFSTSEAMEDETVDPLSLPCSQDSQTLDNEQDCMENDPIVKAETLIDLDNNLVNEKSPINPGTSNERCGSIALVKYEDQKFVPALESPDKPLRVVDSFYGPFPNKVISENASELEKLLLRRTFGSPREESTTPFIVNVKSLTSEQFDECEQAVVDNRPEDGMVSSLNFDAEMCDLFFNRTEKKTTPNFPNAIFEFEEESEKSIPPSIIAPAAQNAASLLVPSAVHAVVAENSTLHDTEDTQRELLEEEQILFQCEMDQLRKERELVDKRHKIKMKSLRYEINALNAHFRDMIHASQLRENLTVLDGSKLIVDLY